MSERPSVNHESFDVLGDVLETLRFHGSVFFQSDLAAPWGMSLAPSTIARFHIALLGDCVLGAEGEESFRISEMDILLIPKGGSHWIADAPGRDLVNSEQAVEACELNNPLFQQGDITHRLLCGIIKLDEHALHPVLDSLPAFMHFSKSDLDEHIWMTVSMIDAELNRTNSPGGTIIDRLTEVLFLQLLNHYANKNEPVACFLTALKDRRIQQALAMIHMEPGFDWTLSSLGERVGMSRSTLVRHFQETVGVAPMTYISNWRLMKAYNLIKYSSSTLDEIADDVGFATSRTLSRAFQRHYGCTPNELRIDSNERLEH